jgi:hypothetical protein
MSSCSSCSSSGNYIAQLAKQATTPPAIQNPAQQPAVQNKPDDALKTAGNLGTQLNISA